jgi:hypothetical protein
MIEAEWQAGTDPQQMLEYVWGEASARKARLFACACCRQIWKLLLPGGRQAVEAAECLADGIASDTERTEALEVSWREWEDAAAEQRWDDADAAREAHTTLKDQVPPATRWHAHLRQIPNKRRQASLIREIFGNPLQPVRVNVAWLNPTVIALARGVYEERAFDHFPILADALEEAGCDSAATLSHCREPGEHVRGCWVLDLLLGKT